MCICYVHGGYNVSAIISEICRYPASDLPVEFAIVKGYLRY